MMMVGKFLIFSLVFFAMSSCSVRIYNEFGDSIYDPVEGSYVLVRNYGPGNIEFLYTDCVFYLENGNVLSKRVRIESLLQGKAIKIRSGMGKDKKVKCKPLPWHVQDRMRISGQVN